MSFTGKRSPTLRFLEKVNKTESCWLWESQKTRNGYGKFSLGGGYQGAHRVSYMLFVGEIPAGMYVCHRCDTPSCVNPWHLFLGTPKENEADMTAKGRRSRRSVNRGSSHPQSILDEQNVLEIRSLLRAGELSRSDIASRFGVCKGVIDNIKSRKTWRHVT
jgi:hypothetical protein